MGSWDRGGCTTGVVGGTQAYVGNPRFGIHCPPPGFIESGIHLASPTGKPLGFLWIHVRGFIQWAKQNLDSGFLARIAHVGTQRAGFRTWGSPKATFGSVPCACVLVSPLYYKPSMRTCFGQPYYIDVYIDLLSIPSLRRPCSDTRVRCGHCIP